MVVNLQPWYDVLPQGPHVLSPGILVHPIHDLVFLHYSLYKDPPWVDLGLIILIRLLLRILYSPALVFLGLLIPLLHLLVRLACLEMLRHLGDNPKTIKY